jgi:hypothetical protein
MEQDEIIGKWMRRLAGLGIFLGIVTLFTLLGMVIRSQETGIAKNKAVNEALKRERTSRQILDDQVIAKLDAEVSRLAEIIETHNKRLRDRLDLLEQNMDKKLEQGLGKRLERNIGKGSD